MSCPERRIGDLTREACAAEGLAICPETAACFGVLERAVGDGVIDRHAHVVVFNTGAVQKYVEVMEP